MKDNTNPDQEKTITTSGTSESAEQKGNEMERAASFTRRALIDAGWTVPIVLSVVLPEVVEKFSASSSGVMMSPYAALFRLFTEVNARKLTPSC